MSELPIYGSIGAALVAVIGVLWRKLEQSEQRERELYRELMKDTEAMKSIARRLDADSSERQEQSELLRLIAARLEEHLRRSPVHSETVT